MKKELTRERIEELAQKIKHATATEAEQHEFDAWYSRQAELPFHVPSHLATSESDLKDSIYHNIEQQTGLNKPKRPAIQLWRRIAAAASVVLCLSVGGYYLLKDNVVNTEVNALEKHDFAPGSNKAVLTLAGGKQIILTGAKNGQLATQAGTAISKTADGEVIYNNTQSGNQSTIPNNTITTPRGGQYHLTLADGTVAWLNAASSITYPVAFTGKERRVEISGEVYFQVAHNAAKPFRVISKDQMVEVLGTHFNVNGYANESGIKTTLLEGSVKISAGDETKILKPGQQGIYGNGLLNVKQVDLSEEVAWKDGFFDFTDANIETIMRQFSRWYDVDIEFQGPVSTETFTGRVARSLPLSRVMQIVQQSKSVKITIEGRRIMVSR